MESSYQRAKLQYKSLLSCDKRELSNKSMTRGDFIMALIKCPECAKEVSDTAKNCPYCSYEMEKNQPNEIQSIDKSEIIKLMGVIAIFFIVVCCYVFYQESRCNVHGCNEVVIKGSKYCEKHTCTTKGCYNFKNAWNNVCDACREKNLERLKNNNSIEKMNQELKDKYGDDIFSDEVHMPKCSRSDCDNEGAGTYGGRWYCSKHLYEMEGYGNIISN